MRRKDGIDFMKREQLYFDSKCTTRLFYYDPDNPARENAEDDDYHIWMADWGNKTYLIQIEDPWHLHDSHIFVKGGKVNGKGAIKNSYFIRKFIEHYEQGILKGY